MFCTLWWSYIYLMPIGFTCQTCNSRTPSQVSYTRFFTIGLGKTRFQVKIQNPEDCTIHCPPLPERCATRDKAKGSWSSIILQSRCFHGSCSCATLLAQITYYYPCNNIPN
uniref:Secreted protein n=1 Tax=Rhizophora mucronata TaxID=61149 RepID=A0A2P2IXD3_RHIMU